MKILNSKIHGYIDYLVVVFLLLSPTLFSLPPITSMVTYAIALVHFSLTISTDFEAGFLKFIPLKLHGLVELIVSIALVPLAFILGSLEGSLPTYFYLGFAGAVFVTWLISDYDKK